MMIGIDVSKERLDVYAAGRWWSVKNELPYTKLIKIIQDVWTESSWVILEPTGGYELGVIKALWETGYRVARPNVVRVSHYARSRKLLSKTDKIDAETLAHFGQSHPEQLRELVNSEIQTELRQLWYRLDQLKRDRVREKNRLREELNIGVKASLERHIAWITEEMETLEAELDRIITSNEELARKKALLESVSGVGKTTAKMLLSTVPELGKIENKALGAMIGVVPVVKQSGKREKSQGIQGGRKEVRHNLYLPTIGACVAKSGPLVEMYKRLTETKPKKVAIIACMNKLLRILNAVIRDNRPYQPKPTG